MHNKGFPGGARSPNIHYCLVVAVKEELLSRPLMPPEKACEGHGVELLPLNLWVPKFGGPGISKPVAHVEDAIAKTARAICEEFQIQQGSGIIARPFQEGRNLSHQAMSRQAS